MPEGDTVWRTARRLDQVFAGQTLAASDLRWPGLSTLDFTGTVTVEVVPRGKHLLHRLASGWTIHSHLRMEGSWRVERPAGPPPASPKVRAVLATDAYRAVGWSLGLLDVVRTADEHTLVGHLGPDLLDPAWDAAAAATAVAHLAASPEPLATALLDQRNLAGLGTIWTAESLFAQRLDPFAPAAGHAPEQLAALVDRARRLLRASCGAAVPSSTGSVRHGGNTYVHGRRNRPCRRCGTLVAMRLEGPPTRQRTIFYCPRCQGVT